MRINKLFHQNLKKGYIQIRGQETAKDSRVEKENMMDYWKDIWESRKSIQCTG